jgi:hypothetical protein
LHEIKQSNTVEPRTVPELDGTEAVSDAEEEEPDTNESDEDDEEESDENDEQSLVGPNPENLQNPQNMQEDHPRANVEGVKITDDVNTLENPIEKDNHTDNDTNETRFSLPKNVIDWSEAEVDSWFIEKNIDSKIASSLKPCNGKVLYQLFKLQIEAREFFYQSISNGFEKVSFRNVLIFASHLETLF